MIRVGTAGWSYPDWEGLVYPKGTAASRDALATLAGIFDVLEINVTFYRPPTIAMAESWVRRVSDRPSFQFTAKLWQGFTHHRDRAVPKEENAFRDGIAPLMESGRLGALLVQYPHSFRNTQDSRDRLASLLDRFASFPLAVEVRHASWLNPEGRDLFLPILLSRDAGFCSVDQPQFGSSMPAHEMVTGRMGYVRLHGRNRANWFREGAGRDARYDYLYSHEEMTDWSDRVGRMANSSLSRADIFIIANNHYRGQAVANAIEMKSLLGGGPSDIPPGLLSAFPRLARLARPMTIRSGAQGLLPL